MKKLISSFLASVKQNRLYWLALLCMGIAFYVMNVHTPFISDDYNYHFMFKPVAVGDKFTTIPTPTKVDTWAQLFESQYNHYLGVNGRTSTHILAQFFQGIVNCKTVTNILNTLIFLLFLNTINFLCTGKKNLQLLFLSFALTLWVLPAPGQTLFWTVGAMNYLWPTTFCLLLLRYCRPASLAGSSWVKCILLLLAGIFVGNMHEGITIGFTGGMFFYLLFNRNERNRGSLFLLAGLMLGAILILVSPGLLHRAIDGDKIYAQTSFIISLLRNIVATTYNTILIYPLILICGLLIIYTAIRKWKSFAKNPLMWTCCCIYSLLLLIGSGSPSRAYFGLSAFAMVLLLQWYVKFKPATNKVLTFAAFLLCLWPGYKALADTYKYHLYAENEIRLIRKHGKDCFLNVEDIDKGELSYNNLGKSRYTFIGLSSAQRFQCITLAKSYYYHKNFIQTIPSFFYKKLKQNCYLQGVEPLREYLAEDSSNQIYTWKGTSYWVIPLKKIDKRLKRATITEFFPKGKEVPLKAHQRFIRALLQYDMGTEKNVEHFNIIKGNTEYWIFEGDPKAEKITLTINYDGTKKIVTFVRRNKGE